MGSEMCIRDRLTGDMVDSSNHYFEAYGALKRGIEQLVKSDIPVFAIAGNHDHDVFPRLASDMGIDGFTVLGLCGRWSQGMLESSSGEKACLIGWSFPDSHYPDSPLDTFELPNVDLPIIGIVHGDLDVPSSRYAPLSLSALQEQPVAVWLLGHVHASRWIESAGTPVLYPGSLQALDPGETGTHGPWLVTIAPDSTAKAKQLPLATVRYEDVEIDVSEFTELAEIKSHLTDILGRHTEELSDKFPALHRVVFRPKLSGRTALYRVLAQQPLNDVDDLDIEYGSLQARVDVLTQDTTPAYDLQKIARFSDPPAILARWLLDLDQPQCKALVQEAYVALQRVYRSKAYSTLDLSLIHI